MKNAGIGCGLFIAISAIISVALPTQTASSVIAYGLLFSIPMLIFTFAVKSFERFKWFVWGGIWALSILLGFLCPIKDQEKAPEADPKTAAVRPAEKSS